MSDFDSSSASDDDQSSKEVLPIETMKKKEKAVGRPVRPRKSKWTWYYDLSDEQRKAENERLRKEFADLEKEFQEIEKYELVIEPFTYKTRGSSLSPNTPPPRSRTKESEPSVALPRDSFLSTSLATVPLSDSTMSVSSKGSEPRRVRFLLQDGSVVSSDDESFVPPNKRPRSGRTLKYDDDQRPAEESDDTDSVGWDSSGSEQSDENSRRHILPSKTSMLSLKQRSSSGQDSDTSASLTKAEVIMKRRERIEHQRSLVGDLPSYRGRSSSEESSASQTVFAKPASIPPHSYSLVKRSRKDAAPAESTDHSTFATPDYSAFATPDYLAFSALDPLASPVLDHSTFATPYHSAFATPYLTFAALDPLASAVPDHSTFATPDYLSFATLETLASAVPDHSTFATQDHSAFATPDYLAFSALDPLASPMLLTRSSPRQTARTSPRQTTWTSLQ
ncbi:hypothetical protein V5799_017348 [Amblyomma americanum]|uniref:Uncharacterized protein n=1 Tax=Amblyomma americanum TaxID=6943 RepID=A0AAQ4F3N4_AMBAM